MWIFQSWRNRQGLIVISNTHNLNSLWFGWIFTWTSNNDDLTGDPVNWGGQNNRSVANICCLSQFDPRWVSWRPVNFQITLIAAQNFVSENRQLGIVEFLTVKRYAELIFVRGGFCSNGEIARINDDVFCVEIQSLNVLKLQSSFYNDSV